MNLSLFALCPYSADPLQEKLSFLIYSSDIGDGGGQPLWDHLPHGRGDAPTELTQMTDVHYSSLGCYPVLPFPPSAWLEDLILQLACELW